MILYPAVDIYDGKAVRLRKGDFDDMTVYGDNPLEFAKQFAAAGADHIHVVDLMGAKTGERVVFDVISKIAAETGMFIETGGGIRDLATMEKLIECGAERLILGTAAVINNNLLNFAVERFGKKVAVGADIKDGAIAVNGWTEKSTVSSEEFFGKMLEIGVKTVICTDISKDGLLSGANLPLYAELRSSYKLDIIASGGVTTLDDIRALRKADIHGAILGKSLYENALDLKKALIAAEAPL